MKKITFAKTLMICFTSALLIANTASAATVPASSGKNGCLKKLITEQIEKSKYSNFVPYSVVSHLGSPRYFDYKAKDPNGNLAHGIVAAKFFENDHEDIRSGKITHELMCELDQTVRVGFGQFTMLNVNETSMYSIHRQSSIIKIEINASRDGNGPENSAPEYDEFSFF